MHANESRKKLVRSAVLAASFLVPGLAFAIDAASTQAAAEPMVVAQAGPAGGTATVATGATYPAYQKTVRAAAADSPDALRRYVYRTRMIWNFRYEDYARQP